MDCILCGAYSRPNGQRFDAYQANEVPEPVIYKYGLPGHFPGNRAPQLTDADYGNNPGTPSWGLRPFARKPVSMSADIGPTDQDNRFCRTQAQGGFIRWVREQYVIPGGPAGAAQGLFGLVHNYGYMTIADTLKPAQQLPRYNMASVDTESLIDRAKASLMRTMFGTTP